MNEQSESEGRRLHELFESIENSASFEQCSDPNRDLPGMEDIPSKYSRLGQMILRLQDEDLERRYQLRLNKWLLIDPEAMEYYIEFVTLGVNLRLLFRSETGFSLLNQTSSV